MKEDYFKGKYNDIITTLNNFMKGEEYENLYPKEKIILIHYLSNSYLQQGKYEIAIEIIRKAKNTFIQLKNSMEYIALYVAENLYYYYTGKVEKGFDSCKNIINSGDTDGIINSYWYIQIYIQIAIFYSVKGQLNECITYNEKSLALGQNFLNNYEIARVYNNMGVAYERKGQYTKSLSYYQKSLDLIKSYNNNNIQIGIRLGNKGGIYYYLGKYDEAIENIQQSINLVKTTENKFFLYNPLFILFLCFLELGNREKAKAVLEELQELNSQQNNLKSDFHYKLVKGLLLSSDDNIKTRIQAIPIFEDLMEHNYKKPELNALVVISLCELNLLLLKAFPEESLLSQTIQLLENQYDKSQTNGSYHIMVQMLFLRSKLYLLEGNYNQAEKCLYQALLSAEEYDLDLLKEKIEKELIRLKKDAEKWELAYNKNYTYSQKYDMAKMEEYLKEAKRIVS